MDQQLMQSALASSSMPAAQAALRCVKLGRFENPLDVPTRSVTSKTTPPKSKARSRRSDRASSITTTAAMAQPGGDSSVTDRPEGRKMPAGLAMQQERATIT